MKALGDLIVECGLPMAKRVESNPAAALLLQRCGRGRRATTIRGYVKVIGRFLSWLRVAHSRTWPAGAAGVEEYLLLRADEPCGRTAFAGLRTALAFVEVAGEVPPGRRVSEDPQIANLVQELAFQSAAREPRPRRTAPMLPSNLLVCLEVSVTDPAYPPFLRGFAWYRLVRIWGSLRFDDTKGVVMDSVRLSSDGLEGRMERTKTSGAGKRLEILEF